MLRAELLEIIANGENSGVEFKRDDIRPEQLAREIVAMANLRGGIVLLGVEDDGTISGVQRDDLETWVMDTVFGRYIHSMLLPFYEVVALEAGKRVAVLSVTMGTSKPYVLRHHGREDIYVRIGSTSRLANRDQQARLFATGGLLHGEALPVSGAPFDALDRERLQDYLLTLAGDRELPATDEAWRSRMVGLGFMTARAAPRRSARSRDWFCSAARRGVFCARQVSAGWHSRASTRVIGRSTIRPSMVLWSADSVSSAAPHAN